MQAINNEWPVLSAVDEEVLKILRAELKAEKDPTKAYALVQRIRKIRRVGNLFEAPAQQPAQ